jgi:hypothetical protein
MKGRGSPGCGWCLQRKCPAARTGGGFDDKAQQ